MVSQYIISQLINGLCQGFIYALIALGFAVIVGIVGLATFTHGEVLMIGAYASFYVFQFCGNNLVLGLLGSFVASWMVGIIIYKVCYERFVNAPEHISLICTIGFSMLLKNLAQIIFGTERKPMLNVVENRIFHLGFIDISNVQLIIMITVIVLSGAMMIIFNKTRWGIALRCVSQNRDAAALVGINVKQTAMIGNCIGCAMAGVAGMLIGVYYQSINPTMGSTLSMKAFAAATLGGLTSVPLSSLGGVILGVIENLGITISSASFRDVFSFGFLIIMLIFKPTGFVKRKGVRP